MAGEVVDVKNMWGRWYFTEEQNDAELRQRLRDGEAIGFLAPVYGTAALQRVYSTDSGVGVEVPDVHPANVAAFVTAQLPSTGEQVTAQAYSPTPGELVELTVETDNQLEPLLRWDVQGDQALGDEYAAETARLENVKAEDTK